MIGSFKIAKFPGSQRAACIDEDPDLFFPPPGDAYQKEPKAICARCEVREACLAFAVEQGESWGIWGGLNERERREYARALQRRAS